jgi:apoptosis-inducing factor 2
LLDGDVVVIGGGYAGVRLAKRLDTAARVTLVDRKEIFFHRIAALRAGVRPEWTVTPLIPYDRLLHNGRVTVGKAVRIDTAGREVVLGSGERLSYDVLVIATGADYPEPARFNGTTAEEAVRSFVQHQKKISTAGHVLVVGGGPSGVELSAEIRLARPGSRVTPPCRGVQCSRSRVCARITRKAASGSSTNTASAADAHTAGVPRSSDTSNHASHTSSTAVASAAVTAPACRLRASTAVAPAAVSSRTSNPTQAARH